MKKVAVSIHAIKDFNPDIIKGLEGLDYIHIDVMDGKFVEIVKNNLDIFKILKESSDIPIIAHLMVKNPLSYIKEINEFIDVFIFHSKSVSNIDFVINEIKKYKKQVGIALNPETKLKRILTYLNKIDILLIMSVNPGKLGQDFIWEMIDKVNLVYAYRYQNNLDFLIDIDGGINPENAKLIHADILTSASAILNAKDRNSIVQLLRNSDKQKYF